MKIQLPEIIETEHPERYIFTLKVDPEQFSFSLYDPVRDGSFFYYQLPEQRNLDAFSVFKQFFFDHPFLASPFRKICIMNACSGVTFVPELLYKEEDHDEWMQFNFTDTEGKILAQKIRHPEMVLLHRMPGDIYQFLSRSFTNPQFIYQLSPLIVYFQMRNKLVNAHQMIANLRENSLDILCFSQGNFVLGNSFESKKIEDTVYFCLFVWKQLKFDQKKDFIYITGNKENKTALMRLLKPYIHNIIPVNVPANDHFAGVDTNPIPFELLSLTLCEI